MRPHGADPVCPRPIPNNLREQWKRCGSTCIRTASEEEGDCGENQEIQRGVEGDGDAKEPAEGPGEGTVLLRHDEFGDFQAGRKKREERNGDRGFVWNGNCQGEESGEQAEHGAYS